MLEVLFELLGEFLLQVVAELGFRGLAQPFERQPSLWLAALSYAVLGVVLGGLSLLVFPHSLIAPQWRFANLIVSPLLAGLAMHALGRWRERHGREVLRIDRFGCGVVFALGFALVRYHFAN
ncbi:hypothetical protein [Inhella gelatinilytica]|uniref:Uncharacterized protein n=1 Tax=Inhella gelatinilytica TaxID=2795030 RepID=A0A931IWC7_9BURK|nr:hypothetical protein [Inhella gelatinilytica]MBH9551273.1 hypothetical protein [Inhella gelatinilytica]